MTYNIEEIIKSNRRGYFLFNYTILNNMQNICDLCLELGFDEKFRLYNDFICEYQKQLETECALEVLNI